MPGRKRASTARPAKNASHGISAAVPKTRSAASRDVDLAADLVFQPDEQARRKGIAVLTNVLSTVTPESPVRTQAAELLAQAYQLVGQHQRALAALSEMAPSPQVDILRAVVVQTGAAR